MGQPEFAAQRGKNLARPARGSASDHREVLDWRHDVIFTSGASEAIEIVASAGRIAGRAHGATEHPIVPHAMGVGSNVIPVSPGGSIDEQALDEILSRGPALVAIQQVNNETGDHSADRAHRGKGPRRRRAASGRLRAERGQTCRCPTPTSSPSRAHKLGGPPGVGVLLVKDLATLEAVGGQEKGYRRGTQDAPAALGFAAALAARPYDMERLVHCAVASMRA